MSEVNLSKIKKLFQEKKYSEIILEIEHQQQKKIDLLLYIIY